MARKTKTLKVQHGTDEVNFGTERFPVDLETDTVTVPEEAAQPLLDKGGAVEFEEEGVDDGTPPLPEGHCWVRHTVDPNATCSFGAMTFTPGPDGFMSVPISMAGELLAHGFEVVDRPAPVAPAIYPSPEAVREPAMAPEAPAATDAAAEPVPPVSVEPDAVQPASEAAA